MFTYLNQNLFHHFLIKFDFCTFVIMAFILLQDVGLICTDLDCHVWRITQESKQLSNPWVKHQIWEFKKSVFLMFPGLCLREWWWVACFIIWLPSIWIVTICNTFDLGTTSMRESIDLKKVLLGRYTVSISEMYMGACPCQDVYVRNKVLNFTRCCIGSQCHSFDTGII